MPRSPPVKPPSVDEHYGGARPKPRRAVRPRTEAEKAFCSPWPDRRERSWPAPPPPATPGWPPNWWSWSRYGPRTASRALLAALERAVAFRRWRAEDVRSILAAGAGTAQVRPAGQALVMELPQVPTRPLSAYTLDNLDALDSHRAGRRRLMTAPAVPVLAADLDGGLRRLKLSAIRRLAPELLLTAKTQRWSPEEFLRTLIDAETRRPGRLQRPDADEGRRVPGRQDHRGVRRRPPPRSPGRRSTIWPRWSGSGPRRTTARSGRPARASPTA